MKKSNKTGVSITTQNYDMAISEKMFPKDKFLKILIEIENRAKEQNLISQDYNIVDKFVERVPVLLSDIDLVPKLQPKGSSAFKDRAMAIQESFEAGYRHECGNIICYINGGLLRMMLIAGYHRYEGASLANFDSLPVDVLNLNPANPDDKMMMQLIASNSNNHPPQWAMTNLEMTAFVYRTISEKGNEHLLNMFTIGHKDYDKKKCKGFIKAHKHPITKSSLTRVLNDVYTKLEEEAIITGMYVNYKSDRSIENSDKLLKIPSSDDYVEIEKSVLGRRLPMLITQCNREDKTIDVIVHLTTSDYAMSEDKLNGDRFKIFSKGNYDQAYGVLSTWINTMGVDPKKMYKLRLIGFRPQHSAEDPTKLIRIIPNVTGSFDVSYVTYQEALKLPSMVIVT
jgi:hypothetical protein